TSATECFSVRPGRRTVRPMKLIAHRGSGIRLCVAATLLAAALAPRTAHAEVNFGAGLIGIAGGNFQDKPNGQPAGMESNPGFGGLTIGGGLLLDVRFMKLVGVEVDVIRSSDHGSGTQNATFNGVPLASAKFEIGQGAWHIPILPKLTFDMPIVA